MLPVPDYLSQYDFRDWPRGRIRFNTVLRRFEVEIDQQLLTLERRERIAREFRLPRFATIFRGDPQFASARFSLGANGSLCAGPTVIEL